MKLHQMVTGIWIVTLQKTQSQNSWSFSYSYFSLWSLYTIFPPPYSSQTSRHRFVKAPIGDNPRETSRGGLVSCLRKSLRFTSITFYSRRQSQMSAQFRVKVKSVKGFTLLKGFVLKPPDPENTIWALFL